MQLVSLDPGNPYHKFVETRSVTKIITKLATLSQLGHSLLPGPLLGLGAAVAPDQPGPLRVLPLHRPPLALRLPLGLPTVLPSAGQKVRQQLEAVRASIKCCCHMLSC